MKKGMVVTVGTGTDGNNMVAPVSKTVENAHPDFLVLLCSNASLSTGREVGQALDITEGSDFVIRAIPDENDLQTCFIAALEAFDDMRQRGIECASVTADFTSGTKAMSAGLVLAAAVRRAGRLSYIAGSRREGKVISGMERFLTFEPNTVLAYQSLALAVRFVERLMFEPAMTLLSDETVRLLGTHEQIVARSLRELARAYHCWERFDHLGALKALKDAGAIPDEMRRFAWDEPATARLQTMAGEEAKAGREGRRTVPTLDLLADLFCNAERRAMEGRYDDAVARLYRATEMLAQLRLRQKHGLDGNNIEIGKLPKPFLTMNPELSVKTGENDGKVKLGLRKDFELLQELGDPLGERFLKSGRFRGALDTRNESLLATGCAP